VYALKRPSHGKLKLANSCWQTQVGVCERRKNSRQTRSICGQQFANVFADCVCAFHTHQLEFANTSLPTLVCRVKAALRFRGTTFVETAVLA